jgi:hypothetical protein
MLAEASVVTSSTHPADSLDPVARWHATHDLETCVMFETISLREQKRARLNKTVDSCRRILRRDFGFRPDAT